jgi:hypothetical protein
MFRWRIYLFNKTPARYLGVILAPDDEKVATAKAIDFFGIEPVQHSALLPLR